MASDELTIDEITRYSRQIMLPEFGEAGQRKLKQSSVLIAGAGGLGSIASLYLAGAGVGHIGLVDSDTVEIGNFQRQILFTSADINKPKVESGRDRLLTLNPEISVDAINVYLNDSTAPDIIKEYDLILDCSDNYPTRYLLNDLCVKYQKPDVYGAVFHYEGQASVFDTRMGPCYQCLFPDSLPHDEAVNRFEAGIFGPVPGVIGSVMATEALKLLLGVGTSLSGQLLVYDALEAYFNKVSVSRRPGCPVCGEKENQVFD